LEVRKPGPSGQPGGTTTYGLVGRARLNPVRQNAWNSRDTVVEQLGATPYTGLPLRKLLEAPSVDGDEALALLNSLLQKGANTQNVCKKAYVAR
jgi:hypothetical protein